jgi:hypothetical protein
MWDESVDVDDYRGGDDEADQIQLQTGAQPIANGADDSGSMLAMVVRQAQGIKRDPKRLIARAKQIGGLLGEDGFYRFNAGGGVIEGESIELAQALAQEWGGIVYQVRILHAEPLQSGGQRVHLRASVFDMAMLVCAEVDQVVSTSPPPGKFANKADQRERWHAMQIQNAASKIVRNAILRVLPEWYKRPALEAAMAVADNTALGYVVVNDKRVPRTLDQARKGSLEELVKLGCTQEEVERFLGQPFEMWAVPQVQQLMVLWRDLSTGKVTVAAWRAALDEKQAPSGNGTSKNKLGLPSTTATVSDEALKDAVKGKQTELGGVKP